jgi:hypothetical protein
MHHRHQHHQFRSATSFTTYDPTPAIACYISDSSLPYQHNYLVRPFFLLDARNDAFLTPAEDNRPSTTPTTLTFNCRSSQLHLVYPIFFFGYLVESLSSYLLEYNDSPNHYRLPSSQSFFYSKIHIPFFIFPSFLIHSSTTITVQQTS